MQQHFKAQEKWIKDTAHYIYVRYNFSYNFLVLVKYPSCKTLIITTIVASFCYMYIKAFHPLQNVIYSVLYVLGQALWWHEDVSLEDPTQSAPPF